MTATLTMLAFYLQIFTINPTLRYLDPEIPYDLNAELLILGTAAQESFLGQLIKDKRRALDLYQMKKTTENDIWKNYLPHHPMLARKVHTLLHLDQNYYAAAMVRVYYWRHVEHAFQEREKQKRIFGTEAGVHEMAYLWKKYYNTELGKGTEEQFVVNYNRLVNEEK